MRSQPQQVEKAEQEVAHKPSVHCFEGVQRRFAARHRGFSLIEILVVVSIIALLVGIGTAVGVKMTAAARVEQTRAMMEGLLAANDEYKALQGQDIATFGPVPGSIYTVGGTERYIAMCSKIKSCDEIVNAALLSGSKESNERLVRDDNSNNVNSIYDRWGTEIEYRQSNDQTGDLSYSPLGDAMKRVANNLLPLSRSPFFASAGPDKQWGTEDDITTID
ncbi:MAG: type II secretion system protein [Phycisphaeraceae bacterium]